MKQRQNAGFSLVEVLVSIVILALVVVPLCTGLVMSVRMNAKADALLQAQLAVSSEIEKLMATGIDGVPEAENDHIIIEAVQNAGSPYYNVTVLYDGDLEDPNNAPLVTVTTTIRAVQQTGANPDDGEGEGT